VRIPKHARKELEGYLDIEPVLPPRSGLRQWVLTRWHLVRAGRRARLGGARAPWDQRSGRGAGAPGLAHGEDQNEFYSDNNWLCGTAGETMIIERNTVLYTSGLAVRIRGNPADKAVVSNNVFASDRGEAIGQTGHCGYLNTMTERLGQLQLGDLDGDGTCDVAPRSLRPELPPKKYSKSGTSPWKPTQVVR
jgi:hypothetical protein